jgi:putative ABC transport system permease protein
VATLVATQSLSRTMTRAARLAANPLAGTSDLQVSNGTFGVECRLVDELKSARIPGLREVTPLIVRHVILPDLHNRSAVLLGVPFETRQTHDNPWGIEIRLTHPLALVPGRYGVFVGKELATALPGEAGTLRIRTAGREHRLTLAGTLDAHGPAAALGGNVLAMSLADAAQVQGQPGQVSRIDLVLEPDADRDVVRRRVEEVVGSRAEVRGPEANDRAWSDVMGGVELGFSLAGAGALLIGLFLVYNALSVAVAERQHDIGILRALGATRSQIARLFAGEAGLLGLAGATFGIPLGWLVAVVALGPVGRALGDVLMPLDASQVELTPGILMAAVAGGVLTALLAALVPSLQAAQQEPADVVRRRPRIPRLASRLAHVAISGLLTAAGLCCILFRDLLPPRAGAFGGIVIVLLGLLTATPLLAAAFARLLQPVSRALLGLEGRLAADNLARSPGRTGLVIAALAAGVALLFQTSGITRSSEDAIFGWVDHQLRADLFLSSNSAIAGGGMRLLMEDQLSDELATVPGIEAAVPIRLRHVALRNNIVLVVAFDANLMHAASLGRAEFRGQELIPKLTEPGTCLVSENLAALYGVSPGDHLDVQGPHGPVNLRVLGTIVDYSWNRGTLYLDRACYVEQFDDKLIDLFDVYVYRGTDPETVREQLLHRWGAEYSLVALTQPELRQTLSGMIRRFYGILQAQEAVVGLVAALGVVTALLISVLQRQRELGLLRAVGATRAQVLRSVLAEALLMGLVGGLIGVVAGIFLEWYAVRVLILAESGFLLPFTIPWVQTGVLIAIALLVAALAGLGPAVRAAHLRIPEAIAYE